MSLKKRVFSAAVFFIVFLLGLVNQWTFLLVFSLFMLVQLHEFLGFARLRGYQPLPSALYLLGLLIFVELFFIAQNAMSYNFLLLVIAGVFLAFIVELFRASPTPMENLAFLLLGLFYIAVPFSFLNFLVFEGKLGYVFDIKLILVFFVLIWATDIGAYFAGKFFGKHSLFKRISPNKTIEGFIGGTVSNLIVALLIAYFFEFFSFKDALAFWLIIIICGTIGDLIESMFKRQVGIKDSGKIMPGHGGLLDRFDSTLVAVPFIILYLYW